MPYDGQVLDSDKPCPDCGGSVKIKVWDSSDEAFTDYHYICQACPKNWWIDGPDA